METNALIGEQQVHAVLPVPTADEFARQEFVKSLKYHLATRVAPGVRSVYQTRLEPEFRTRHGRAPANRRDVKSVLGSEPYYRRWSALERNSQEMMWQAVQLSIERQLPQLIEAAKKAERGLGSLRLTPDFVPPAYVTAVDIHLMPGGYHTEVMEGDVAAGALYDRGVYVYVGGRMGPQNADVGQSAAAHLRKMHPDFQPRRILDIGCTVGNSTLPWADAYPGAELHGIDVSAPILRYAHARAESLGKAVHYSQQSGERTDFPDAHFDLIVTHFLLHETSRKSLRNIMREAHRLLAPGGILMHAEMPSYKGLSAFDEFMLDWDTLNNNEPFWAGSRELDPALEAEAAGFPRESVFEAYPESYYCTTQNKPTRVFKGGGEVGGGWRWYAWGARK
jgi:SAM-dependent methyltransferase